MTPNEQAAERIRELAKSVPAVRRYMQQGATSERGYQWGWMGWGQGRNLGAIEPIDTSGFPTRRPAVQPTTNDTGFFGSLGNLVKDTGVALATAYANKEISEQQQRAMREQMKAELQRAELANERARQEAIAQQNALAAQQYERERLEAQQAELNLDKLFSSPWATAGVMLVGAGVIWSILRAI